MKLGSTLRWRLLHVRSSTEEAEALKQCRASAVRATIRKYLRREQKRTQLAKVKLTKILENLEEKKKMEEMYEESPAAACTQSHPAGAMAPENTTQYLMNNVYEDMKTNNHQAVPILHQTSADLYSEFLSPRNVYTALDSGYESCLAFQQRDFEEAFHLCW